MEIPADLSLSAHLARLLEEVIANGAPAQSVYASDLLGTLSISVAPGALEDEILTLADAYRNDPYLWRE